MYKAVIVDDEKIVRLALETMIDWRSRGFIVTGSYGSAPAALEGILSDPPDLIIADIKMPDMDGLQLIEKARRILDCPIIILTNHQNFSYAVDAIHHGVMDYVLKTDISPETLTGLLVRARALLDGREKAKTPAEADKTGTPDFRLLEHAVKEPETSARPLSQVYSFCFAFLASAAGQAGPLREGVFYNFLCENSGHPSSRILPAGDGRLILLIPCAELPKFRSSAGRQCERIDNITRSHLNRRCGFILSGPFADTASFAGELDRCAKEAGNVLFSRMGEPNEIAFLESLSSEKISAIGICGRILEEVSSAHYEKAMRLYQEFTSGMLFENSAASVCVPALQSIFLSVLIDHSVCLADAVKAKMWDMLSGCRCLRDYDHLFAELIQSVARGRNRFDALLNADSCSDIISCIRLNLTRHISLAMISQSVHMTENYISRLFKAKTGMNVIYFINLLKMECARALLCNPQNTVRDAAAEVGFSETGYFIRLFRKIFCVDPGKYKSFTSERNANALLH